MVNLPVKWFDNRFHGIPLLSGTPGAFTDLSDARARRSFRKDRTGVVLLPAGKGAFRGGRKTTGYDP